MRNSKTSMRNTQTGTLQNDKKGKALVDLINFTSLVLCNQGKTDTFRSGSIIDLTIATAALPQRIKGWRVLDEVSLSDHFYIAFSIENGPYDNTKARTAPLPKKIELKKLETSLRTNSIYKKGDSMDIKNNSGIALPTTQILEKYYEFGKELHICFVDFRQVYYDSIIREKLWKVLKEFEVPVKLIQLVKEQGLDKVVHCFQLHTT
ncbi:Endonuclease/exonuclease/phosphatase [Cinara cedri]|uniref:Endonuclease/exonuclease/phosphatase n=1 Tax=Cinara cedri TaxID=506608 RepID=A0A5E4N0L1_9HEMI|nr:Endonuclease/exonuclease/phosphatase [Cinara cedri]